MTEAVVVVPVLARPHRVEPFVAAFQAASPPGEASLLFVVDPDDHDQRAAIAEAGECALVCGGSYARKVNAAYRETTQPWLFLGADDLEFRVGWLRNALALRNAQSLGVIGTNDLSNPRVIRGRHSTHSLVARAYADDFGTIDERRAVLHEGYAHNFCDDELIATARFRRAYGFAMASHVKHLHPNFVEGVERDATYEKGQETFEQDRVLFASRTKLWRHR